MATTLDRPQPPTRRRLDVKAYYRMAEAGILGPEDRVELIEGDIIEMAPIGSQHAGVTDQLVELLGGAARDRSALVAAGRPLRLDDRSEPQPDLMLLRRRDDYYRREHPGAADVLLLIEVAASSLDYDRTTKLPLYARHGVPEVWIVDLADRAIEVYRQPDGEAYRERSRLTTGTLRPSLLPQLALEVEPILA